MESFINNDNKVVTTGKLKPAIIIEGKDPEEKMYLVLYIAMDEDKNEIKSWELIEGRTATYKFIKGMIEEINIYDSKVVVETVTIEEAISVYEFMAHASKFIDDSSFDIEDYNYADANLDDKDDEPLNYADKNNFI